MPRTKLKQITSLIESCQKFLILIKKEASLDDIASACALSIFLQTQNKKVHIVSENFSATKKLRFIFEQKNILNSMPQLGGITIKISEAIINDIETKYITKNGNHLVHIKPQSGSIKTSDLNITENNSSVDAIITVGISNPDQLGKLYTKNTTIWHDTPIINIDHQPSNDYFGTINITNIKATSNAEVIHSLINSIAPEAMNQEIAEALLTGIIAKTNSFKNGNTRPQLLVTASKLMKQGADRTKIIHNLYQTHSLATLRLWGRILSDLKTHPKLPIAWVSITQEDFLKTGSSPEALPQIIDEIFINCPEVQIIALLNESIDQENVVHALVHTKKPYEAHKIAPHIGSSTNIQAICDLEHTDIFEAEKFLIGYILERI